MFIIKNDILNIYINFTFRCPDGGWVLNGMVNVMINIIDLKKQIVLFNLLILYKNKKSKIDDLYNYRMNMGTWCYCKKC